MKQISLESMRRRKFFSLLLRLLALLNPFFFFFSPFKNSPHSKRGYMFGYYKSVKSYLDLAFHPVETAMTNHDDLVHLLVRLGASVNSTPKSIAESSYHEKKISLKDWIDNEIYKLNGRIKSCNPVVKDPTASAPECSGWQKFYREYEVLLNTPTEEEARKQSLQNENEERERLKKLEKLEDVKAYFVEVKQLIEDHGHNSSWIGPYSITYQSSSNMA
jgi:hypothetical protein